MEILLICSFLFHLHSVTGSSVKQQPPYHSSVEGDMFTMTCEYENSALNSLQWYKQIPGKGLDFLKLLRVNIRDRDRRFTFQLERENKSSALTICDLEVGDSAVYWCAYYTGSSYGKLIFGHGTRLHVNSKTHHLQPSVYKLKASEGKANELPDSVCLITDFPDLNRSLSIGDTHINLPDIAVLDSSSDNNWRYSTVVLKNDSSCSVTYNANQISPASDTGETKQEECTSKSLGEHFKINPSLNTMSLTVFGLRILTAKAIVFNLILTLRLWSS